VLVLNSWHSTQLGEYSGCQEPIRLEIRNDSPLDNLVFAVAGIPKHGVYRRVHFQHTHECLCPGFDHRWSHSKLKAPHWPETKDLERRMYPESIADCVPGVVAQQCISNLQLNEDFVFFEGVSDCKDFLVTILKVRGKVLP
jgi:hypothetical protein